MKPVCGSTGTVPVLLTMTSMIRAPGIVHDDSDPGLTIYFMVNATFNAVFENSVSDSCAFIVSFRRC